MDKTFYENQLTELNEQNKKNIFEAYDDIKRAVLRQVQGEQELNEKFKEIMKKKEEGEKKSEEKVNSNKK